MRFCFYFLIADRYRNLWETQFRTTHGIVFVVDSTDKLRLAVARDELWLILDAKEIAHRRVRFFALWFTIVPFYVKFADSNSHTCKQNRREKCTQRQ